MIRLACFDFDGTLASSLPEIAAGVRELARQEGLEEPSDGVVAVMIGRGVRALVEQLRAWWSAPERRPAGLPAEVDELLFRLVGIWSARAGALITEIPGAFEGVRALRRRGVGTWIVTNKEEILVRDFLRMHALEDAFDGVLGGSGSVRCRLKPWPDMIEHAMRKTGTLPEETVMIGDSSNDALAARAAGVRAMLVETGYNGGVPLREWAASEGFEEVYPDVAAVCREILGECRE